MAARFFYGTLCHRLLREAVLGHEPKVVPARLPGHRAVWVAGEAFPTIVEAGAGDPGAEGVLALDLTGEDLARLDFFEGGFGYNAGEMTVHMADGSARRAQVYVAQPGLWRPGAPWVLADWAARWAETAVAAAQDHMSHYPDGSAEILRRRLGQMMVRAGSRLRAAALRPGTESLRRRADAGDVAVEALRHPYQNYFAVEERDLSFRRFDGSMSAVLNRAVFISGDASVVLPYDPLRDRVMVIEQFRAGPQARGDANPWLIEAVAGRIDGGETPQDAAHREAREEAGLTFGALLPGPRYYPSPAAKGEYLYTFVGLADLPDEAAGLGGLASEAEDIRSHVIGFGQLMDLVASGEADNAPLIILAYWLERERPRLRAEAGRR